MAYAEPQPVNGSEQWHVAFYSDATMVRLTATVEASPFPDDPAPEVVFQELVDHLALAYPELLAGKHMFVEYRCTPEVTPPPEGE